MAENVKMDALRRTIIGKKVKTLRKEGKLPAVIYGQNMVPAPIVMDLRLATKILRDVTQSTLIDINLGDAEHTVLVRERQYDVIRRELSHIDFLAVSMTEVLRTNIRLRLIGDSPAVAEFEAMVMQDTEMLDVEALPGDLPESIDIDISVLTDIGSTITVADLDLGSKVNVLADPESVIAVAIASTRQEEEEELEEDLLIDGSSEPEVIERGKREEEDEE